MTQLYCPCCDAAIAPEQLTEPPFATCTSCKLSVLAKWRRVPAAATSSAATPITPTAPAVTTAPVAPALATSIPAPTKPAAWPPGFVVEETAPLAPLASVAGDPYRSAPRRPERAGLTITWHTKRPGVWRIVLLFIALWSGLLTVIARAGDLQTWLGLHVFVGFIMLPVLFGAWMNRLRIHAGSESLSRHAASVSRDVVLPIERIAQLFTRKLTTPDRDELGNYVDRVDYVLFARDHAGGDHEFVSVQTPEQAWWLEARLEHHLGLVDREHMPGPNLAVSSRSP
jgi:hypothetical protein